jgi:signal-transduction protein with cAMP-binding, CBS, and nucleotidyltransferase domain
LLGLLDNDNRKSFLPLIDKLASSIGELMTQKLVTIALSNSAQEAAIKMKENDTSSLVVIDGNNKPVGIVTERDLVTRVCVHGSSSKTAKLEHVMSSPVVTIDALSSVEVAADIMTQNGVRHLLVAEDEDISKPLGIISTSDFVRYLRDSLGRDSSKGTILDTLKKEYEKNE